ncbi:MAG: SRPBCC family protein [Polyangiales bacterium]
MAKLRKSISIHAPVDRVFDYAANADNVPEYWPSMIEVSNKKDLPSGGHEFDWTYKMAGMRFHGHSTPIEYEQNRRLTVRNEKGIESTLVWSFEGENGGMRLTLEVEYQIPPTLLGKLAQPFILKLNERELDSVLENIKAITEATAPVATNVQARTSVH